MGAGGTLDQVAVAGGTGLVGRHLAAFLAAGGTRVTLLSRSERVAGLPEGVELRHWRDLPGALEGAGAVVNLCGEGIAGRRWSASRREALVASRVGATERLVDALGALQARPGVLVNASATGYYGPMDERPLDESAGPGTGFLAQLCRRWEAAADGAAASGVRVVKLRLGMVLARDGGALPRLALPARLCLGARLGRGQQGISWIHVDDLVRLILEAAANPACRGPVNATAPAPVTNEAFDPGPVPPPGAAHAAGAGLAHRRGAAPGAGGDGGSHAAPGELRLPPRRRTPGLPVPVPPGGPGPGGPAGLIRRTDEFSITDIPQFGLCSGSSQTLEDSCP